MYFNSATGSLYKKQTLNSFTLFNGIMTIVYNDTFVYLLLISF